MKRFTLIRPVVLAAFVILFSTTSIWALGPEGHTAEVSVGGGYANLNPDPNENTTSANHGRIDVSASYNVFKDFSFGGEYTFSSLASETFYYGLNSVNLNAHLHNYGGLLRFGLFNTHVAQPYLLIDGGGLDLRFNQNDSSSNTASLAAVHNDHYGTYAGAGLGVNAYLGHGFGIRPEVRYSRQQLNDNNDNQSIFPGNGRNEISATAQVFYTFGRHAR